MLCVSNKDLGGDHVSFNVHPLLCFLGQISLCHASLILRA
jgi:hypothetical protein